MLLAPARPGRGCWAGSVPSERASASSSLSSPSRCWGPRPRQRQAAPSRRGTPCTSSSDPAHRPCRTCEKRPEQVRGTAQGAARAAGVGVGGRGGAPTSRARVDRLRTLATLVRVGGRVHEHAVLWMLAIRERRLARWRSRLVAAAHTRSMRGSAERERERGTRGVALCVLTSSQRRPRRALWPMSPCLSAHGSVSCARRRRQQRTFRLARSPLE